MTFLLALSALAALVLLYLYLQASSSLAAFKGRVHGSPIVAKAIFDLDERFALTRFGPPVSSTVQHIAGIHVEGGISDLESWILCNYAKTSQQIFELGTATGKTTYLLALNAPAGAEVVTITLHPDHATAGVHERGDDAALKAAAVRESAFDTFLYTGTDVASKITQLFGDSKEFNEIPFAGSMDLIFIDGAHTESYVRSDTKKALTMLRPGGWLFWHDYRGRRIPGVWRALNDLSKELPLVRIKGTSLVAYHKPA